MDLIADLTGLIDRVALAHAGTAVGDEAAAIGRRLAEPLRVAIVGRMKSGKSTLLNALVGQHIAPTDAGECTKVVTWYQHDHAPSIEAVMRDGGRVPIAFRASAHALDFELPGTTDEIDHVNVHWPTPLLADLTLVDTPGIDSPTPGVIGRTERAILPDDVQPGIADIALYVLQNKHPTDLNFLEAFAADGLSLPSPLHCIGVLARADEIGAARLDALDTAGRVAARLAADIRIRRLCNTVSPVAALPALGAGELTELQVQTLRNLASSDRSVVDDLLLDATTWSTATAPTAANALERQQLLDALGLWGVRTAIDLLRTEPQSAAALAMQLVSKSGLNALRKILTRDVKERSDLLRARSALIALDALVARSGTGDRRDLLGRIEALVSGCHELDEASVLAGIRGADLGFDANLIEEAERLLGAAGTDRRARLGLDGRADQYAVSAQARLLVTRWRSISENPFVPPEGAHVARVVSRSAEGLVRADPAMDAVSAASTHPDRESPGS
ncbi:MAG: dynamin family protein [Acidimicrobiales bacterium]